MNPLHNCDAEKPFTKKEIKKENEKLRFRC